MTCALSSQGEKWAAMMRHAAEQDSAIFVRLLLREVVADKSGLKRLGIQSALCAIAGDGNDKVIQLMIRTLATARRDLNAGTGRQKWTALHHAAAAGHLEVVKVLVGAGADVGSVDTNKRSALHLATRGNHTTVVDYLLARGASPLQQDKLGNSPLHVAAMNASDVEITAGLLLHGADIRKLNRGGRSPPYLARIYKLCHDTQDLLAIVSSAKSSFVSRRKVDFLHMAAESGHLNAIKVILREGLDPGQLLRSEQSPLHSAAIANQAGAIHVLIDGGAKVNSPGRDGMAPLHVAATNGRSDAVVALLSRGADINARDSDGMTPLQWACLGLNEEIADLLLRRGADETMVDKLVFMFLLHIFSPDPFNRSAEEEVIVKSIEGLRKLLERAPADRAWRRRGLLVLCRARAREEGQHIAPDNQTVPCSNREEKDAQQESSDGRCNSLQRDPDCSPSTGLLERQGKAGDGGRAGRRTTQCDAATANHARGNIGEKCQSKDSTCSDGSERMVRDGRESAGYPLDGDDGFARIVTWVQDEIFRVIASHL